MAGVKCETIKHSLCGNIGEVIWTSSTSTAMNTLLETVLCSFFYEYNSDQ